MGFELREMEYWQCLDPLNEDIKALIYRERCGFENRELLEKFGLVPNLATSPFGWRKLQKLIGSTGVRFQDPIVHV